MSAIPVILLKTKSSPSDPYDDFFTFHEFPPGHPATPVFVPVLQHRHVNTTALSELISEHKIASEHQSERTEIAGLIITSQRAVEALGGVLAQLADGDAGDALRAHCRVYVVGPATAAAVVGLGFAEHNVLGAHCGNGAVLAEFVRADYEGWHRAGAPAARRPLLFLNNAQRGDVIPSILAGHVPLRELIVYETGVVDGFRAAFDALMRASAAARERWVVVFSPTGADVALEVLRHAGRRDGTYWASIGPATEAHLIEKLGFRPDVVAEVPTPEGLWNGIQGFRERQRAEGVV